MTRDEIETLRRIIEDEVAVASCRYLPKLPPTSALRLGEQVAQEVLTRLQSARIQGDVLDMMPPFARLLPPEGRA